jgi:hypothetical protein
MKIISLRTKGAILFKANNLGYGQKRNVDNGETYFTNGINHISRRTKDEILAEEGKVPIPSAKSVEDLLNKSTDIIAKKINAKQLNEMLLRHQRELTQFFKEHGVCYD